MALIPKGMKFPDIDWNKISMDAFKMSDAQRRMFLEGEWKVQNNITQVLEIYSIHKHRLGQDLSESTGAMLDELLPLALYIKKYVNRYITIVSHRYKIHDILDYLHNYFSVLGYIVELNCEVYDKDAVCPSYPIPIPTFHFPFEFNRDKNILNIGTSLIRFMPYTFDTSNLMQFNEKFAGLESDAHIFFKEGSN